MKTNSIQSPSFLSLFAGLLFQALLAISCTVEETKRIFSCLGEAELVSIQSRNDNGDRSVNFSISYTGDMSVGTVTWVFGDGSTGSGTSTSHTYSEAGSYTVQASVNLSDNDNYCKPQKSVTVIVE